MVFFIFHCALCIARASGVLNPFITLTILIQESFNMKFNLTIAMALCFVFALPTASLAHSGAGKQITAVKEMPAAPVIWADDDKDDDKDKKDKKK
jgi:hypothetical protein